MNVMSDIALNAEYTYLTGLPVVTLTLRKISDNLYAEKTEILPQIIVVLHSTNTLRKTLDSLH